MDSFTQIALGAAVGEAVLGKKVGNRAMVWGAIGGTIPDLDIIANFFTDEMTALAFHRSISHSFFFAVTFPFLMGWAIDRLYKSGLYKTKGYKSFVFAGSMFFYLVVATVICAIPILTGGSIHYPTVTGFVLVGMALAYWIYTKYFITELTEVHANWKDWAWLSFWAIFTHPLLDCCTAYGTQVFQPFSDYRVALNNISVVDPIYTFPLLIGIFLAARLMRHSEKRALFNAFGLGASTAYLIFTFWHKHQVNQVFEASMDKQEIVYERYMTSPTIFNNVLWNCLAEGNDAFYFGQYSFYDKEKAVTDILTIPKNHALIDKYKDERDIKILKWFSNDYYAVMQTPNGDLQVNDLRFGITSDNINNPKDYIFRFELKEKDGQLMINQSRERDETIGETFVKLWNRIWGK